MSDYSKKIEDPAAEAASPEERDVLCPLCDYNLRGLPEPRCPECGHRSTWEELLNRPPLHPYLFEHHPRRNLWSFLRTAVGVLLPIRFWRSLSPTMLIRPGRMYLFAIIVLVIALLSVSMGLSGWVMQTAQMNALSRVRMAQYHKRLMDPTYEGYDPKVAAGLQSTIEQFGSIEEMEAARFPRVTDLMFWQQAWQSGVFSRGRRFYGPSVARAAMIVLLWGPLTVASLMIFRASLRQAKIKNVHVLRCVVYSGALLTWLGPILLIGTPILTWWIPYGRFTMFGFVDAVYGMWVILLVLLAYRLVVAYWLYLRFRHAVATVLASQVIVGLALLKVEMWMLGH